ncbi:MULTISPECIES: PPK2 family polyphosphate kinase [Ruminococcus]|uniref:Polyphosphate:nucleotide phosphotransferase, PPK2 family n=1 Tax=Ruminococcus flavefaciens TaxID=1265 RepID=A0A1M7J1P6_RUMFL|nr:MULTISPECIES: PPK2 family polyphosphate kinase [Ruminococcus]MCR4793753.1 polyphosphate kinase 2 family protein [Ruminococcus sp.]SHM46357.1 polyphosphate:nucleotide phosphotransferase, PPK2 family [Ruminococcus flavefaciens]
MKADKYIIGSKKTDIRKLPTNSKDDGVDKEEIIRKYEENKLELAALQDKFYADAREGLIVVIQALDASGKDSTIKNVFSGINPQGVKVHYYKAPTSEELAHDYLWRIHQNIPRRGEIAIFNRSHYEDLVTVQAEDIWKGYHMSDRVLDDTKKDFFEKRYEQVNNFEKYLYENSYRVVKIFLHVSKEEQTGQLLERIELPEKNWKFRADDLKVRDKYDAYLKCFNDVINKTSTKESPWYVLPGDQRWYTRYLVTEILLDALKACKPEYPELPAEEKAKLDDCRKILTEAMAEYEDGKTDKKSEKEDKKSAKSEKKTKKKSKK